MRRRVLWLVAAAGCRIELNPAFIEGGASSTGADATSTSVTSTSVTSTSVTSTGVADGSGSATEGTGEGSATAGSSSSSTDAGETATGATTTTEGSADTGVPAELTIFLTSTLHQGSFGGLAEADAICTLRGQTAGLGTTFMAVMSDGTVSAAERLTIDGPVRDVNGQLVAMDGADLFDGTIAVPVELDENGQSDVNIGVWSGTTAAGGTAPDHCSDWTAAMGSSGMRGLKGSLNGNWIAQGSDNCIKGFHLCCIEQP